MYEKEILEARKCLENHQTILAAMPRGEDPKRVAHWVGDRWDDGGKWSESLQDDPARTAWNAQAEKVEKARAELERFTSLQASLQAEAAAQAAAGAAFIAAVIERLRPLDGKKVAHTKGRPPVDVYVYDRPEDPCVSVGTGAWGMIVCDEGGWADPFRARNLSRAEKEDAAALIQALRHYAKI